MVGEDPCDQSLLSFRVPCNFNAVCFADFGASQDDKELSSDLLTFPISTVSNSNHVAKRVHFDACLQ